MSVVKRIPPPPSKSPEKSLSLPDVSTEGKSTETLELNNVTFRVNKRKRIEQGEIDLDEISNKIKNDMQMFFSEVLTKQNEKFDSILNVIKDVQSTSNAVESAVSFLSEENTQLKKKIDQLIVQSHKDKEQIIMLENKLEDFQRMDRKSNIEIRDVPLKGSETKLDILSMVQKLADNIEIKLEQNEVKDIVKIHNNKSKKSTLIVELTNTFKKTEFMKAAKNFNLRYKSNKLAAKHLGINTTPDTPIFISENLTSKAARLYFLARDLKISKKYKYCWTGFGKVFLRYDDKSPIINITSEEQVHALNK